LIGQPAQELGKTVGLYNEDRPHLPPDKIIFNRSPLRYVPKFSIQGQTIAGVVIHCQILVLPQFDVFALKHSRISRDS